MINTIQTREDINQTNGINALQEEAIKETNNTKEIVKDFEETENKITDLKHKKEQTIKAQKLLQENHITKEQYENIIKNMDIHKITFTKGIKETENNRTERIKKIEEFKQQRKLLDEKIAAIPDIIIEYFDKNSQTTIQDAINTHFDKIKDLDGAIQMQIIEKVITYKKKIDSIEKYMDKYKSSPVQLLCEMRGIKSEILSNPEDIKMERLGTTLVFHINNELDYMKVYEENTNIYHTNGEYIDKENNTLKVSGGFATPDSKISELEGTLSVLNNARTSKETAMIHEDRHNINRDIFGDKERTPYLRAQDEILAYLKDGSSPEYIYNIIGNEGGLYNYHEEILDENNEKIFKKFKKGEIDKKTAEKYIKEEDSKYKENRSNYSRFLKKSIEIAEKFKISGIDNYLDLLTITPIEQRGKLELRYKDKLIGPWINALEKKILKTEEYINLSKENLDYWEKKGDEDRITQAKDRLIYYEKEKKMYEEMLEKEKEQLNNN